MNKINRLQLTRCVPITALLLLLLLSVPSKVYGYTDPGTGTYIYQALYAGFIGGTFYFRKFLRRLFGKRDK